MGQVGPKLNKSGVFRSGSVHFVSVSYFGPNMTSVNQRRININRQKTGSQSNVIFLDRRVVITEDESGYYRPTVSDSPALAGRYPLYLSATTLHLPVYITPETKTISVIYVSISGCPDLYPKWVKLTPNGTNPVIFSDQIQYIWLGQMY